MSRWLASVNNLLETLDGQAEAVVDDTNAALRGRVQDEFDDDDYDSDDSESEYDSEELESEFEEEEEVVMWEAAQEPLFDNETEEEVQPYEAVGEEPVAVEEVEESKPPAVAETKPKPTPPPPPPPAPPAVPEPVSQSDDDSAQKAKPPPPPPPIPAEPTVNDSVAVETAESEMQSQKAQQTAPPSPPQISSVEPTISGEDSSPDDTAINVSKSEESASSSQVSEEPHLPPPPPPNPAPAPEKVTKQAPMSMSGIPSTRVESPPASGYASAPNTATRAQGNTTGIQQQLKRSNRELKKVQAEARQLRKHVMQLNAQLESAESEMAAQRQELQRAAERMEQDRVRNNEEREDLLDEHDEELENMKEHYEKLLAEQKEHYEEQAEELHERLSMEEEKRMQEGGDWTKELEDSVQREREALKRLGEVKEENAALKSQTSKLEAQQAALQKKLESTAQNFQTASQREREAEDKLDAALSLHSRQLSQRQTREAELERMIADLGAALTVARQKEQNRDVQATSSSTEGDVGYRKQYELASEELETVKVQLSMESQRCEALRQELHDISKERTEETYEAQARQQQHDRDIADLTANVARLEASLREKKKVPSAPGETTGEFSASSDEMNVRQLKEAEEELKGKITSLSEQLIRAQTKNDRSKSEILALKNRLQASNARAESAEQALAAAPPATTSQIYQAEAGVASYGTGMRRRVKGGRGRSNPTSVRSIRSALNMQPGRVSEGTEQVAATIDAVDSFLVETGSFMRHEPLARLAFLLYLIVLHLWAFCLVLFHAHSFEKEHGDFGSLSVPGEASHP